MEAGGDAGERLSFRCLHAARYAAAAVMTVLVATITYNTVNLVLYERSHDLVSLSVVRGAVVFARRRAGALVFCHGVRVSSARGFRYYAVNTTACLFDGDRSAAALNLPEEDAIVCFRTGRTIRAIEQRGQSYFLMEAEGTRDTMNSSYFDALHDKGGGGGGGSLLRYVTLRLGGAFVTERRSGWNTTSRNIMRIPDHVGLGWR